GSYVVKCAYHFGEAQLQMTKIHVHTPAIGREKLPPPVLAAARGVFGPRKFRNPGNLPEDRLRQPPTPRRGSRLGSCAGGALPVGFESRKGRRGDSRNRPSLRRGPA